MPGFLEREALHSFLAEIDLLVALRFPSCGETSGMVAHALRYATPVAVSEFAAFREEPAAFRISVDPCEEVEQLARAFETAFDGWRDNRRLTSIAPARFGQKREMARFLGELVHS